MAQQPITEDYRVADYGNYLMARTARDKRCKELRSHGYYVYKIDLEVGPMEQQVYSLVAFKKA